MYLAIVFLLAYYLFEFDPYANTFRVPGETSALLERPNPIDQLVYEQKIKIFEICRSIFTRQKASSSTRTDGDGDGDGELHLKVKKRHRFSEASSPFLTRPALPLTSP